MGCGSLQTRRRVMAKMERLLTPVGEAKWAHVQEPKAGFNDKEEPKYCIDVVFSPDDAEWAEWAKGIKVLADEAGGGNPVKWEKNKDPNDPKKKLKTGNLVASFHTSVKMKPGLFDYKGVPMGDEVLVGNGSMVRINYSPKAYPGFGGGVTLYLNAIQVMDLVEFRKNSASDYGFEVDDAAVAAAAAEAAPFADEPPLPAPTEADLAVQEDDEDLPF